MGSEPKIFTESPDGRIFENANWQTRSNSRCVLIRRPLTPPEQNLLRQLLDDGNSEEEAYHALNRFRAEQEERHPHYFGITLDELTADQLCVIARQILGSEAQDMTSLSKMTHVDLLTLTKILVRRYGIELRIN